MSELGIIMAILVGVFVYDNDAKGDWTSNFGFGVFCVLTALAIVFGAIGATR